MVVTFLALLELIRLGEFRVDQASAFGEIEVERQPDGRAGEELELRADYGGEPGPEVDSPGIR